MISRLTDLIVEKLEEMDRTIALKSDLRETEALAIFRSNRGKALMDEANVFLSSIIRSSDERLTTGIAEQRRNATWLRWVSAIGGLVIIVVVGGVTITIFRYAREIMQTRDEVQVSGSIAQAMRDLSNSMNIFRACSTMSRPRCETRDTAPRCDTIWSP
jgi:hypothetical protein